MLLQLLMLGKRTRYLTLRVKRREVREVVLPTTAPTRVWNSFDTNYTVSHSQVFTHIREISAQEKKFKRKSLFTLLTSGLHGAGSPLKVIRIFQVWGNVEHLHACWIIALHKWLSPHKTQIMLWESKPHKRMLQATFAVSPMPPLCSTLSVVAAIVCFIVPHVHNLSWVSYLTLRKQLDYDYFIEGDSVDGYLTRIKELRI